MLKIHKPQTTEMNINILECSENNKELKMHIDDDQRRKPTFLFSVDYILNKAGEKSTENETDKQNSLHYEWLYCTRFKPPKLDSMYLIFELHKFKI